MPENLLSDQGIKKAKPGDKPRKLSDGGGLLLEVRPEGGKWWRARAVGADVPATWQPPGDGVGRD